MKHSSVRKPVSDETCLFYQPCAITAIALSTSRLPCPTPLCVCSAHATMGRVMRGFGWKGYLSRWSLLCVLGLIRRVLTAEVAGRVLLSFVLAILFRDCFWRLPFGEQLHAGL